MKIALIGFGFIAQKGHLPTYQSCDDLHLTAVVDPVLERREVALKLCPGIHVYESIEDLFQDKGDDIDLVDICSPNAFHLDATRKALAANKHVLCEKPLAIDAKNFEEISQFAKAQNCLLYPCHNYKFAPSVQRAAELIQSGKIGAPLFASFQVFRVSHARGVPEWQPHWRRNRPISGGGIAIDHGVHLMSIAHSLFGGFPTRVSAHIQNLGNDEYETENTALICLDWHPVLLQISLSWIGSARKSSFRVQGTLGEICIDNDDVILIDRHGNSQACIVLTDFDDPSHSSWFKAVIRDVQKHIQNRNFEPDSLLEAGLVAEAIEKAHLSSKNGGGWFPLETATSTLKLVV